MKIFDPHVHMTTRTTDDLVAMAEADIYAIIEPAFWTGQPRIHPETFEDYFLGIIGWEQFRANQFGIHHFCTLSLNPKEANNKKVAKGVLEMLPRYLEKDNVLGIGEIGFDDQTPEEEYALKAQLEMALEYDLPVLIHTPHRDKKEGTKKIIALLDDLKFPQERALIDHNTEDTLPIVLETKCWAGHSIYPHTKMTEKRMTLLIEKYGPERIIINSAADWGVSDPLKVPKTVKYMRDSGFSEELITKVVWHNPIEFFSQSGKLDAASLEERPRIDQRELWEGNSVLRGQAPKVDD
jgi:uncharacterized protein